MSHIWGETKEHVEGNTFVIEFDSNYITSLRMQTTGSFDMIAQDDAMRHCGKINIIIYIILFYSRVNILKT